MVDKGKPTILLGLGSNVGNRLMNLRRATCMCEAIGHVILRSAVYESAPLLPPGIQGNQRHYLNSVIALRATCSPEVCLQMIRKIETLLGRPLKRKRWASRIIDIDILFWQGIKIKKRNLTIPHKEAKHRSFTIIPIIDLLRKGLPTIDMGKPISKYLTYYENNNIMSLDL